MSYPLFSLAKCSSQKAVGALESLDRALDRFAERVEKTCDSVVDSVDRTIATLEQQAVQNYLAPGPYNKKAAPRAHMNMQQRKRMQALQAQKLNQLRAEAAMMRTTAARSAAARQYAMRKAAQQHQLKTMQGQRMPGMEYNTLHAGRTPMQSQVRRVYGANRGVNNKKESEKEVAQKVAKKVCKDIERSVTLQQAWAALVEDRMGMQAALEAKMIQKRAAHRERDAAIYSGDEEELDSESVYSDDFDDETESEADLKFDDFSDSEEEDEVDEEAVANWQALVAARLAKQNANAANWASMVDAKMAKHDAVVSKMASMVDAKVAKHDAVVSKWAALASKMAGRHHFIGDFYPELENDVYAINNENDRELYYIGGDESAVMTDIEGMVGVLGRDTGAETGIETEAERWEYVGTSDAEDSDFEDEADTEEVKEEEKKVETSSRWWW